MTTAQTKFQAVQRQQSEKRSAFNKLNALPAPDDSQTAERDKLNGELDGLEVEYRAALDALEAEQIRETRQADDGEGRELRALVERANVGDVLVAAIEHRSAIDGPMGELQQFFELAPNQIPVGALRLPAEKRARVIERAAIEPGGELAVCRGVGAAGIRRGVGLAELDRRLGAGPLGGVRSGWLWICGGLASHAR